MFGKFCGGFATLKRLARRWLRGGFPAAYLARSHRDCFEWLESFCRTFVESDLAQLGVRTPGVTLRRFWAMLAHRHGQTWNSTEFARAFGVADTTVRRYLDILSSALRDLKLKELVVIHAGEESWPMAENIRAVAARRLQSDL